MAFSIPNEKIFEEKSESNINYDLDLHISNNFYNTEVVNIHTNTSFNDTLKEDMLWSLIYEESRLELEDVTIGSEEFNPKKLQSFLLVGGA